MSNSITFVGKIEGIRENTTPSGTAAINAKIVDDTASIKINLFGKVAEKFVGVAEGTLVVVSGNLNTRNYHYQGRDVSSTEIRVTSGEIIPVIDAGAKVDVPAPKTAPSRRVDPVQNVNDEIPF